MVNASRYRLVFFVFIALLLFDLRVLSSHSWDPRALILQRSESVPLEQGWGIGYDGQWYYAIALDPTGAWRVLDQPAYRYQRILYPLLASGLGLAQPELVPWAMLVLNLLAAALGAAALGELLRRRGASPWVSLVYIFSLGFLLTIRLDLLEPLALALALWGWLAAEHERPDLAICLFALGGLTKEIALVFPLAFAVWAVLRRDLKGSLYLIAGSLAPYLAWYEFLHLRFGASPTQALLSHPLWIPFSGLRYLDHPASQGLVWLWVLAPAVLAGLAAGRDLIRSPSGELGVLALLVLAQAALVATLPAPTWADPLAILRSSLGLVACVLVWLAAAHRRALPYAAALWLPSASVLFLVPGMI